MQKVSREIEKAEGNVVAKSFVIYKRNTSS